MNRPYLPKDWEPSEDQVETRPTEFADIESELGEEIGDFALDVLIGGWLSSDEMEERANRILEAVIDGDECHAGEILARGMKTYIENLMYERNPNEWTVKNHEVVKISYPRP